VSLTVSLVVNAAVAFAFLWFIHKEREATARVFADMTRMAHDRELGLLQRIQAPAAEVVRYHYDQEPEPGPPAIDVTDEGDEDFWSARMSKEELAHAAAYEELSDG
jgi:hypothetical protein